MIHESDEEISIQEEEKVGEFRVVKLETPTGPTVEEYSFDRFRRKLEGNYKEAKKDFGSLAATDEERQSVDKKSSRFELSGVQKRYLSIEDEERRVIEGRVSERVEAISDEVRKQAKEEGLQIGRKEGHDEAYKSIREEGRESLERFQVLMESFEKAKEEIFKANERFIIDLVFRLVKMITLKELETDREYPLRLAKEIIEKIGVRDNIRIRVHPDDADVMESMEVGLSGAFGRLTNLNIETSNQVRVGGCQVDTEWNAIDASIETQLEGIAKGILGAKK